MRKLAAVRGNLQELAAIAEIVGPELVSELVEVQLTEMGTLRSKDALPPKPTSSSNQSIKVRQPQRYEMPPAPGPSRKVPISTSYNAERYVPIRVLWAKVIIRAAYDFALWKDSKDLRLKKFAQDAERWLFESSQLELSFENICFAFDFPLEKIRQKTRALTKQDVKKLEFRERHGRTEILEDTIGGNDE